MKLGPHSISLKTQRIGTLIMASSLVAIAIILVLCASELIGEFLTHAVHESGHALACVAQGGTVANWGRLLKGNTDCKPSINVLTTVGGASLQLSVWILATAALMWWASRWTTANRTQLATALFWVGWSLHNVLQPISWMRHLTPTGKTEWDPARLIRLTHVDPATVVASSWVVFALLLAIAAASLLALARPTCAAVKQAVLEVTNDIMSARLFRNRAIEDAVTLAVSSRPNADLAARTSEGEGRAGG